MRILNVCRMREMFSDMPFMYSIVAVVVGVCVVVCFGSSSRSVSVTLEKVFVVVVFRKKHGQGTCSRRISCLSCYILVPLVA